MPFFINPHFYIFGLGLALTIKMAFGNPVSIQLYVKTSKYCDHFRLISTDEWTDGRTHSQLDYRARSESQPYGRPIDFSPGRYCPSYQMSQPPAISLIRLYGYMG